MDTKNLLTKVELTDEEKELCDYFIEEYQKDYDYDLACIRMGVSKENVNQAKRFFLSQSYVQVKMAKECTLDLPNERGATEKVFRYVVGKLKSIADKGRVRDQLQALEQISKMYGLTDAKDNTSSYVTNVMQVPVEVAEAEWEEQAQVKMSENMKEE